MWGPTAVSRLREVTFCRSFATLWWPVCWFSRNPPPSGFRTGLRPRIAWTQHKQQCFPASTYIAQSTQCSWCTCRFCASRHQTKQFLYWHWSGRYWVKSSCPTRVPNAYKTSKYLKGTHTKQWVLPTWVWGFPWGCKRFKVRWNVWFRSWVGSGTWWFTWFWCGLFTAALTSCRTPLLAESVSRSVRCRSFFLSTATDGTTCRWTTCATWSSLVLNATHLAEISSCLLVSVSACMLWSTVTRSCPALKSCSSTQIVFIRSSHSLAPPQHKRPVMLFACSLTSGVLLLQSPSPPFPSRSFLVWNCKSFIHTDKSLSLSSPSLLTGPCTRKRSTHLRGFLRIICAFIWFLTVTFVTMPQNSLGCKVWSFSLWIPSKDPEKADWAAVSLWRPLGVVRFGSRDLRVRAGILSGLRRSLWQWRVCLRAGLWSRWEGSCW